MKKIFSVLCIVLCSTGLFQNCTPKAPAIQAYYQFTLFNPQASHTSDLLTLKQFLKDHNLYGDTLLTGQDRTALDEEVTLLFYERVKILDDKIEELTRMLRNINPHGATIVFTYELRGAYTGDRRAVITHLRSKGYSLTY